MLIIYTCNPNADPNHCLKRLHGVVESVCVCTCMCVCMCVYASVYVFVCVWRARCTHPEGKLSPGLLVCLACIVTVGCGLKIRASHTIVPLHTPTSTTHNLQQTTATGNRPQNSWLWSIPHHGPIKRSGSFHPWGLLKAVSCAMVFTACDHMVGRGDRVGGARKP